MSDLSTRNLFAAAALQGLLANPKCDPATDDVWTLAFEIADKMEACTHERKIEAANQAQAKEVYERINARGHQQ